MKVLTPQTQTFKSEVIVSIMSRRKKKQNNNEPTMATGLPNNQGQSRCVEWPYA